MSTGIFCLSVRFAEAGGSGVLFLCISSKVPATYGDFTCATTIKTGATDSWDFITNTTVARTGRWVLGTGVR